MERRSPGRARDGVLRVVTKPRSIDHMFDRRSRVERILAFEAALARVSARAGVIPDTAANSIERQCDVAKMDLDRIERGAELAGNEAIPTIEQLRDLVAADDDSAATYVHWGATSQDAIDTALVLQLNDALELIDDELAQLIDELADLADLHAATPMVGRTLLQEAAPTTFGFKVAGWLDALLRHRSRLATASADARVIQFGGAVGNLSALGAHGPRIAADLAAELQLANPALSWHTARDRLVNLATTLAAAVGSLGKMARDISLLAQSEIAEVREPTAEGRGRSSTMPQKRNPIGCAVILAAATRAPALATTMLAAMPQEHERGLGGWHAEWSTLPDLISLTHDAIARAVFIVAGLEVDAERMARNIEATNGRIFAEAVSFALSARFGRKRASEIVARAIRRASEQRTTLRLALEADGEASALTAAELEAAFDVRHHLGVAEQAARRVATAARSVLGADVRPR
jgi:3-carboxy-cis,cis-muconate cycloisomerase